MNEMKRLSGVKKENFDRKNLLNLPESQKFELFKMHWKR